MLSDGGCNWLLAQTPATINSLCNSLPHSPRLTAILRRPPYNIAQSLTSHCITRQAPKLGSSWPLRNCTHHFLRVGASPTQWLRVSAWAANTNEVCVRLHSEVAHALCCNGCFLSVCQATVRLFLLPTSITASLPHCCESTCALTSIIASCIRQTRIHHPELQHSTAHKQTHTQSRWSQRAKG